MRVVRAVPGVRAAAVAGIVRTGIPATRRASRPITRIPAVSIRTPTSRVVRVRRVRAVRVLAAHAPAVRVRVAHVPAVRLAASVRAVVPVVRVPRVRVRAVRAVAGVPVAVAIRAADPRRQ